MAITIQSPCYLDDVFQAMGLLLRTALDSTVTHIFQSNDAMIEGAMDGIFRQKAVNFASVVAMVDGGGDAPSVDGSGRLSSLIMQKVSLRLFTRRLTDKNYSTEFFDRKHWGDRQLILNAVQDRLLYSVSPDLPWLDIAPDGRQLSAWPMRARVEQPPARKNPDQHDWGESNITVLIPFRLLLDVPPY